MISLYRIRNWARGLTPLYISICAALLLDLKSNMRFDHISILYDCGLISFIIACIISNALSNRCNNYGRIYDIEFSEVQKKAQNNLNKPDRKLIYENGEKNRKNRFLQYYGVFGFGILGLLLITLSYISSRSVSQSYDKQRIMLQSQVDSLKIININYKDDIYKLKRENDSIKNLNIFKTSTSN
jgi:hypothetical protein